MLLGKRHGDGGETLCVCVCVCVCVGVCGWVCVGGCVGVGVCVLFTILIICQLCVRTCSGCMDSQTSADTNAFARTKTTGRQYDAIERY